MASSSANLDSRRMLDYIVSLFPRATSAAAAPVPPWALFENFFRVLRISGFSIAEADWFARMHASLTDADARLASFVASGRQDSHFLLPRRIIYVISDDHELSSFSPVTDSVLFHLVRSPGLNRLVGVSLREAQILGASFRSQSESLSHTLWVLSALLGYIKMQGFVPCVSSRFNHLVTSVSKGLAPQSSLAAQFMSYIAHKRRGYYLSLLLVYFPGQHKCSLLLAPASFADSLFRDDNVSKPWRYSILVQPPFLEGFGGRCFPEFLVRAVPTVLTGLLLILVVIGNPSLLLGRFFVVSKATEGLEADHRSVMPQPPRSGLRVPWRPRGLFFGRSGLGTGWCQCFYRMPICRFWFIRTLADTSVSVLPPRPSSSVSSALVCRWPLRSSPGSWLRSLPFSVTRVSVFCVT